MKASEAVRYIQHEICGLERDNLNKAFSEKDKAYLDAIHDVLKLIEDEWLHRDGIDDEEVMT